MTQKTPKIAPGNSKTPKNGVFLMKNPPHFEENIRKSG
jgi:hypothetical protein